MKAPRKLLTKGKQKRSRKLEGDGHRPALETRYFSTLDHFEASSKPGMAEGNRDKELRFQI